MSYNVSIITCPLCDLKSKQEKRFYRHLKDAHGVDDPELCYIEHVLEGVRPTCQCSDDCDKPVKWSGWKKGYQSKYVRGHNARIDSVYNDPEFHKRSSKKRKQGYAEGRYKVWNDGLTKETDERVAQMSQKIGETMREGYASGRLVDWRVDDPEKAARVAQKMSETKKRLYAEGKIKNWNNGLTKETDERVALVALKISQAYERREMGRRLSVEDVRKRIDNVDGFKLVSSSDDYRTRRVERLVFECTECGERQSKSLAMLEETPVCFKCHPKESLGQLELYEFVKGLGVLPILSDRNVLDGKEIDVLVPGRLGIEYDGLWYHSERRLLDKKHATNKMRMGNDIGLQIIRVFEDEWSDKRKIIESLIMHRLGFSSRRVYARKCSLRMISFEQRKKFFDDNHLEGDVRVKVAFGLFDGDHLVAALSLRRAFHRIHGGAIEVARFCTCLGTSVIGGLSRLVKASRVWARDNGYQELLTYVDGRIGNGQGYMKAGFQFERLTVPRIWWTDFRLRYNRFKFRADAKRGLTEKQAAKEAGVAKIYGCPNLVLKMGI